MKKAVFIFLAAIISFALDHAQLMNYHVGLQVQAITASRAPIELISHTCLRSAHLVLAYELD